MKFLVLACFIASCSLVFGEADLELQSIKAVPDEGSAQIPVTLRFINRGPSNAENLGCNLYLYSYQKLIASQTFLLKPLAAEETREEILRMDVTAEPLTRIKAEVYDSVQSDTQPSTNFIQVNLKPPDYRNADLEIVEASIENNQPVNDKSIVLHVRLRNNGPDMIPNTRITADLQVYNNSVGKGQKRIDRLASGETTEEKFQIPLGKSIAGGEGTVHLEWIASDEQLYDPEKTNQTRDLSVQLTRRMPDLIPKDIKVDKKGILVFLIVNKGNASSEASTAALFLNGALTQRYAVPALQPNANFRIKDDKVTIDSGMLITAVADYNADVAEMSEENNRLNSEVK
jgi:hypothetical protein